MNVTNPTKPPLPGARLALFSCFFAILVIGLGAFTRLVDAGLGCPDWPGCYGHALWPNEAHEIEAANAAFPDAPVEADKTWPEMVHRYLASSLGLLSIILLWRCVRNRRNVGQPMKLPLFLLGFIILQGLFGMWTVTLKLWPQVVTAHLLGGFITLNLFWLMTLRLYRRNRPVTVDADRPLRRLAIAGLLVVFIQIALGGWTTSNYAAVACPDLPTCQQQWLPPMDFKAGFDLSQHVGPNYLGGQLDNAARVAIHISHRVGAIVVTVVLIMLGLALRRQGSHTARQLSQAVFILLALQVALGLGNVLLHFPVSVAVAHNITGALLLVAMVTVNYAIFHPRRISGATQK